MSKYFKSILSKKKISKLLNNENKIILINLFSISAFRSSMQPSSLDKLKSTTQI